MVFILVVIYGVCVMCVYMYSFMSVLYGVLYSDGSMLQLEMLKPIF